MSTTPTADDDGPGYGEWWVDAVSLFQQLINLYSRGRKFNVLEQDNGYCNTKTSQL